MSGSKSHKSVKVRHGRTLVLGDGPDAIIITVMHARRGEARLVVEAPRSVSISTPRPTPEPHQ